MPQHEIIGNIRAARRHSLKQWDRFSHVGVKGELQRLRKDLGDEFEFGSSGEGELTARGRNATAYARKLQNSLGRVSEIDPSPARQPIHLSAVLGFSKRAHR